MQTGGWVQLVMIFGGGLVFYFKSMQALREEISKSEERLRAQLDGVHSDVHRLDVAVARLDERMQGRVPSAPAPAE